MECFVSLRLCSVFDSENELPVVIQHESFSQYFPLDMIQRSSVLNIDFKMLFLSGVKLLIVPRGFNITLFTFTLSL